MAFKALIDQNQAGHSAIAATAATSYAMSSFETMLFADASGDVVAVTLPQVAECKGKTITVYDAGSGNNVTVNDAGDESEFPTATLDLIGESATFYSDGRFWHTMSADNVS